MFLSFDDGKLILHAVMKCHLCKEEKLSKEFPHEHLTKECIKHPLLHCLRCVTASVRDHQKCSVSECGVQVTEDNMQYKQYLKTLEFLFPTVAADGEDVNPVGESQSLRPAANNSQSQTVITTLSGECISIEYNPNQTISELKDMVYKRTKTSPAKQCLLYNDTELEVREDHDQQPKRLKDYDVQPNSTIYLLVLLYKVPEDYDRVIFDLFWGYPESGRDFLDASVFLFSGSRFIEVVDYRRKESRSGKAVKHSGDVMDDDTRVGHHTINLSIKSIPSHIDRLVFTLSAWNSPNISKYPNISLQFFDASCPNKQLCDDKMDEIVYSQAVIMCFLNKRDGKWQVVSVKHGSQGNALDYNPLKCTIKSLIERKNGIVMPSSTK